MPFWTRKNKTNVNKNKAYKNLANARKTTGRFQGHSRIANIFSPTAENGSKNGPRVPEATNISHNNVKRAHDKVLAIEIAEKLKTIDKEEINALSSDVSNIIDEAEARGSPTVSFTLPIYTARFLKIALVIFGVILIVPSFFLDMISLSQQGSETFTGSLLSSIETSLSWVNTKFKKKQ